MTADMHNDSRILRERQSALRSAIDRARAGGGAFKSARQLVSVIDRGNMPSQAGYYYACNPVQIDGAEQEGGSSTPVVDTSTVLYVAFEGSAPNAGDTYVATAAGGRWVATKGGSVQPPKICVSGCGPDGLSALAGTTLQLTATRGKASGQYATGKDGCATIADIPPGNYEIVAHDPGGNLIYDKKKWVLPCNVIAIGECCLNVTVTGCFSLSLPGATVSVKDSNGKAVGSATADANGFAAFLLPGGDGTYTITASGVEKYQDTSVTQQVVCSSIPTLVTVNMETDSAHVCGCISSPPTGTTPATLADPAYGCVVMPRTLTLNDGFGDVTLTYTTPTENIVADYGWGGCATRIFHNLMTCVQKTDNNGNPYWDTECYTGELPVYFFFACVPPLVWGTTLWWVRVVTFSACPGPNSGIGPVAGMSCPNPPQLPNAPPWGWFGVVINLGTDNTHLASDCEPFFWTGTSDPSHEACHRNPDGSYQCIIDGRCITGPGQTDCSVYQCQTVTFTVTE
jgi:hypothetical protein